MDYDRDVWSKLDEGYSYKEIAEVLDITEKQVNHSQQRRKMEGQEERLPKVERSNDTYLIRAGTRVVSISEVKLKMLKELYCADKMTINQVCRKLDISRRNFHVIKTAFGITKDDVPFLDDELVEEDIEDLVSVSMERRKDQYFTQLEQSEIKAMRKELHKYRQQDYFLEKIHAAVTEHFQEFNQHYTGPAPVTCEQQDGHMLEVAIVDLHLGKLAWSPEVGSSYDYKIARKRFHDVIDDIYCRAADKCIEKILYVCGSDFFHYDTITNSTTAGTPMDSDLRWHKLYAVGLQMLIESIDRLATLAPVEVIGVPGNHDKQTVFYATHYLAGRYENSDVVTVSDNLRTRKYIEYGKNLLGFSHGDKEGKRLPEMMPIEVPAAWGRTRYREFHVGHLHHERSVEKNGLIVRNLSSVTGTDAWHFESGFVGNVKKAQSFLWHKDRGLSEIWHTNID